MLGAIDLGIANDSKRACREQATQIAVTLLTDPAEALPASTRMLLRHESNPGREVSPCAKHFRIGNAGNQRRGQHMTNAGNRIEPLARLVGSMPGRDHAVELQELCFQGSQLGAESQQTGACNLGQSFVTYIGDDTEEVFNTSTSNRCDDAKLGKMGTDRVDN